MGSLEFLSKWDGILLSMTKIQSDDILEGLYKIKNTRVGEGQDRVGIVWLGDSSEESLDLIITDWRQWWKRSIEQNLRIKNLEARNANYETKRRGQESGDKTAWTSQRAVFQRRQLQFSVTISISVQKRHSRILLRALLRGRMREMHRESEVREASPSGRMLRLPCKDYLKRTCTNSFCEKWHPPECLFYKSESGCSIGEKCSYAHRQVEEQPSKRSKKNDDKKCSSHVEGLHDNWVAYFKKRSRRSLDRFCGRAQTYWNQSDVFNSQKPSYVMLTLETKIHR